MPHTQSPMALTHFRRHAQLAFAYNQIPIDIMAGWAAPPVDTRPPGPRLYGRMEQCELKFLAQRNNTKVATEPRTF